jgi:hypothetical protein
VSQYVKEFKRWNAYEGVGRGRSSWSSSSFASFFLSTKQSVVVRIARNEKVHQFEILLTTPHNDDGQTEMKVL